MVFFRGGIIVEVFQVGVVKQRSLKPLEILFAPPIGEEASRGEVRGIEGGTFYILRTGVGEQEAWGDNDTQIVLLKVVRGVENVI